MASKTSKQKSGAFGLTERVRVIADLVATKERCRRYGLLRTMDALDEALQIADSEMGDIEGGQHTD